MKKSAGEKDVLAEVCSYHKMNRDEVKKCVKKIFEAYQKMRWVAITMSWDSGDLKNREEFANAVN